MEGDVLVGLGEIHVTASGRLHDGFDKVILGRLFDLIGVIDPRVLKGLMMSEKISECMRLEPDSPRWQKELVQLNELYTDTTTPEQIKENLQLMEKAYASTKDKTEKRLLMLPLMRSALAADELRRAGDLAHLLLLPTTTKSWNAGNEIHYAQLTLGLIALHRGD